MRPSLALLLGDHYSSLPPSLPQCPGRRSKRLQRLPAKLPIVEGGILYGSVEGGDVRQGALSVLTAILAACEPGAAAQ